MTVYYASDLHFGHANIIKLAGRPFKDVEEMDKILIENWNRTIKPNDEVWYLGDFTFSKDEKNIKTYFD
jgi:calcineurin-like phosphoesterase family protein